MFNFFKKKVSQSKSFDQAQMSFLVTLINRLKNKYPNFQNQLDLKTFVSVSPNPGGSKGSFRYGQDAEKWKTICDSVEDNFFIKNIRAKSVDGSQELIEVFTSEGLIIGYNSSIEVSNIDLNTIDVSNIWEKHFFNNDYSEIEIVLNNLTNSERKKLDFIKNTFKISINHKIYFPIQDKEDGNYIAIDKEGIVYKITHDPFQAIYISNSLKDFLNLEEGN